MFADWKDGELAYLVGLVETRGNANVQRERVAEYLRVQSVSANSDPALLPIHRYQLATALSTAAYLVDQAMLMLPFYAPKVQAPLFEQRWIEARNILAALHAR